MLTKPRRERCELRGIVADGHQETYFKDGGRRADHLEVELNDIDYIDVSF
ncbi:hypothetical protein [Streptomyces sp. NPDC048256]